MTLHVTEEVAGQTQSRPTKPSLLGDWRFGFRGRTLIALLLAEVTVLAIAQLPLSLSWDTFAFMDQGANLSVQTLLDRGLVPTVDFGYLYGLLPLLIGRLWFGLFGLTPSAYAAAMLVVDLLIAWGLARCLLAMKAGPAGIALVVVAMPWAALASYINLAHAIEATLICHALAEHALGRRSRALALLTACLFVKPTMAYLYGLLLLLLIVRDGGTSGVRGILRQLAPSAAAALILLIICGGWFGVTPVMNSLLPSTGAASYSYLNFGFFRGVGRRFWLPDNVWPAYYLVTPAGHYLVGTVVLFGAAAASLLRQTRRSHETRAYGNEVVVCCAIMQLAFLTTFYGDFMSWTYYYYILIIGLTGVAAYDNRLAAIVFLIAAAALVGDKYEFSWIKSHWETDRPAADMAALWTSETERREWHQVLDITKDRHASILSVNGEGVTVLVPGFAPTENFNLFPKIPLASDLNRKLHQVESAEFVLVRNNPNRPFLDLWPEFRTALDGCEEAFSSTHYLIFKRSVPPTTPLGAIEHKR
jgi:hypothetical protein